MALVLLYKQNFNRSISRIKALAFCQNCPGQEMPNTSGLVLCFRFCALTSLESLVFEAQDCLFGFSYCSPCRLAEGHSESKGRVRKKCWRERRWGKCSRWDQRMFFILQNCLHISIKRILCLLVYFCMQHAKKNEKGFFICFSVTVGSADSASDLSLFFLPVLCSKTFSASVTILMSSEVQLTHMRPLHPICYVGPPAQLCRDGPGWASQAAFMHSFALLTSSSSDKLAAAWKLLLETAAF